MNIPDEVRSVLGVLESATNFAAIFGPVPAGDKEKQRKALRSQFAYLAQIVHPDRLDQRHEDFAGKTFRLLNDMWKRAEAALEKGIYDEPFRPEETRTVAGNPHKTGVTITSASSAYQLQAAPYRTGDFSEFFRARAISDSPEDVLIKIAIEPANNGQLEKEIRFLRRFHHPDADPSLVRIRSFIPEVRDTFLMAGDGGRRHRTYVMKDQPGFVSLVDIMKHFQSGLDPRDAAWIIRRVIAQAIAASMAGIVHGAIVPDHVLVHPVSHEPLHIGWLHGVELSGLDSGRMEFVIDRWEDWYPPEVWSKKTLTHATDIYMAGKTMLYLLSGDTKRNTLPRSVPDKLSQIVRACVNDSPSRRPQDGRALLDECTRVIRELWGKAYRPLVMPVC